MRLTRACPTAKSGRNPPLPLRPASYERFADLLDGQ
jgi:hypothetical protein